MKNLNQLNSTYFCVLVVAASILSACGDDGVPMMTADSGTPPMEDAGAGVDGAVGTDSGEGMFADLSCGDRISTEAPGANVNRRADDFTLPNCADEPYTFYNDEFCEAKITVISIAAGWCPPCIAESMQLRDQITRRYEGMGVRLIQVITEREDTSAPTAAYCQAWVDRFGLENIELYDVGGITSIYFPDNALPSTIIVNQEGIIVFRENGATDGLTSLRTAIEEQLALAE